MLKIQVAEVSNVPPGYALTLNVLSNGAVLLDAFKFSLENNSTCSIDQHFFIPYQTSGEPCIFDVTLLPVEKEGSEMRFIQDSDSIYQTNFVLSSDHSSLRNLTSTGAIVRRFPLRDTNMFLKLRISKHGYVVKVDDVEEKTTETRVRRLINSLAMRSQGQEDGAPPLTPSSSRRSAPSVNEVGRKGPPRKELPKTPVEDSDDSITIRNTRERSCVVRKVFVKPGVAIFHGEKMFELVEVEHMVSDLSLSSSRSDRGLFYADKYKASATKSDYSGDLYSTPAETQSSNNDKIDDSSEQFSIDDDKSVYEVVWDQTTAGLIKYVDIEPGDLVQPNEMLVTVETSPKHQQLAHLHAADKLGFSNRQGKTNINSRFQSLTEKFVNNIASGSYKDVNSTLQSCYDLEGVVRDFTNTARTYGRVIISEIHLEMEEKTIRPIFLGGVLGGHKYVVRGVLFKIPDGAMFRNYPDPLHIANKIQGHELKGLKAYFGWFFNRGTIGLVSFPLTAIIDFKGHRITAMTQLPIQGSETLIYGADDAGGECRVKNEVPSWSNFIKEASLGLHLKSHFVVNGRSQNDEIELASCVDLEGHRGRDQRHYLLDFSRALPCAYRKSRLSYDQLWPYYHLLRAEFVGKYKHALCADAFSNFQSSTTDLRKQQATANNNEVKEATDYLLKNTVKLCCQSLLVANDENLTIAHIFHREGLNMRYLGVVYSQLVSEELFLKSKENLYKQIKVEALMRVLKGHLRMRLRNASMQTASREDSESRILSEVSLVLNGFFAHSSSPDQWNRTNAFVFENLQRDFNFTESHAKKAIFTILSMDTVDTVGATGTRTKVSTKFAVLKKLNEVMGLGIDANVMTELQSAVKNQGVKGRSFHKAKVFWDFDFTFQEKVKHLDIVERVRGLAEYLRGRQNQSDAFECYIRAFGILAKALETSPNDAWLNLLMADLCRSIWEISKFRSKETPEQLTSSNLKVASLFEQRALRYYQQSTDSDNHSHNAQRNFGIFLSKIGKLQEAEDHLLKSLELAEELGVALDESALLELVYVLEEQGKKELASQLKNQAKSWIKFHDSLNVGELSRHSEVGSAEKEKNQSRRSDKEPSLTPPLSPAAERVRMASSASAITLGPPSVRKDKPIAFRKLKDKIATAKINGKYSSLRKSPRDEKRSPREEGTKPHRSQSSFSDDGAFSAPKSAHEEKPAAARQTWVAATQRTVSPPNSGAPSLETSPRLSPRFSKGHSPGHGKGGGSPVKNLSFARAQSEDIGSLGNEPPPLPASPPPLPLRVSSPASMSRSSGRSLRSSHGTISDGLRTSVGEDFLDALEEPLAKSVGSHLDSSGPSSKSSQTKEPDEDELSIALERNRQLLDMASQCNVDNLLY